MYDAIVVGGGPAGSAAALALGRVSRSVLVVDEGIGRNAPAEAVHNFLTRDGTPPAELRALAAEELARFATVERVTGSVVAARAVGEPDRPGFELDLDGGETVRTRRLVLATGVVDTLPAIDGLAPLWGRSALHCPYCHGYEVRGRPVAVLGAADAHERLAVNLARFASDVVLLTNGATVDEARLGRHGVRVRTEAVARFEGSGGQLERVVFAAGEPLARHAIFVQTTPKQRSSLPDVLGVRRLEDGSVEVDDLQRTSVPGVVAAGDMCRRPTTGVMASVIVAAASGTIAGAATDHSLVAEDFELVPAR